MREEDDCNGKTGDNPEEDGTVAVAAAVFLRGAIVVAAAVPAHVQDSGGMVVVAVFAIVESEAVVAAEAVVGHGSCEVLRDLGPWSRRVLAPVGALRAKGIRHRRQ